MPNTAPVRQQQQQQHQSTDVCGEAAHSQVTRHGCAARNLCRGRGRAVLVRLAETSAVHEAECLRVIEEGVENRAGVEHGNLVEVGVRRLKLPDARCELSVVVGQGGGDFSNGLLALHEDERRAVRGRDGQEQEGACPVLVQDLDLPECHQPGRRDNTLEKGTNLTEEPVHQDPVEVRLRRDVRLRSSTSGSVLHDCAAHGPAAACITHRGERVALARRSEDERCAADITVRGAYDIINAYPEGEKAVRACPPRPDGFRGEDVVELGNLVDNRPAR